MLMWSDLISSDSLFSKHKLEPGANALVANTIHEKCNSMDNAKENVIQDLFWTKK